VEDTDIEEGEAALLGVPGLPPLADLPHPALAPSDDALWDVIVPELTAGADLGRILGIIAALLVLADAALIVLVILVAVR